MMMNSIKANASFIIPRLGLMVVLLWVLWFFTNIFQTTWVVLCKQVGPPCSSPHELSLPDDLDQQWLLLQCGGKLLNWTSLLR